ncbi:ABC transporter substrate-binding protein [Thiotrichales bacterium 19S9-12]|nr:ABC transporter substrate-binding protein [Thiotrichales bacterium 19S9-11]MCF6811771.1 ABC transporter substrate-binding protein [Thiotrichales bacterium 19S9-12]
MIKKILRFSGVLFFCFISLSNVMALAPTPSPKRVVVLELSLLDNLMLLDVKPVAIAGNEVGEGALPGYMLKDIKSFQSVGIKQQPSLAKIASFKPDLIIADITFHKNIQTQLEKIAPTIMLNGIMGNPQDQINNINRLAIIFHKEKQAHNVIKHYQKLTDEDFKLGQAHPATILMGYVAENGMFRALSQNAIATEVLKDLGKDNLIRQYSSRQRIEMTPEAVLAKNPDAIAILLTDNDASIVKKLTNNPIWQQIPAVKTNKVYFLSRDVWAQVHGLKATEIAIDQAKASNLLTLGMPKAVTNRSQI